ncbi:hypothetical protein [Methylobacterium fujisawaense]|uniref:hypothetical protein n=1 Tax=Methylobacterium fujisawaense TaxID=107400 RepID=UPI002F351AF2
MKRRSARPFMVEVKQTRSARTTLTATEARPRPDKILWPELAQAALAPPAPAPAPQAAPAPRPERKVPDAPVRRVLPSLMPMFEAPAEPVLEAAADEAATDPAAETVPGPRPRPAAGRVGSHVGSGPVAPVDGRAADERAAARRALEAAPAALHALIPR